MIGGIRRENASGVAKKCVQRLFGRKNHRVWVMVAGVVGVIACSGGWGWVSVV